ncbi:hypothetical protein pb186bvf_020722 [Paramecium bursaria]
MSHSGQLYEDTERDMHEFSDDEQLAFFQNMDQIYTELPGNIQNYATFSQSLQIGKGLTNYAFKNAMKVAEERHIERNIPINAYQEVIAFTDMIFTIYDNTQGLELQSCYMLEDEEPV